MPARNTLVLGSVIVAFMTYIFLIFLTILTILGIVYLYKYARDSPYRISADAAKQLLRAGKFDTVLDVRTNIERSSLGYYPDSIHIPSGDLEAQVANKLPNRDASILVYCNTGQRARKATEKLHELGYKNAVYIATGHWSIM